MPSVELKLRVLQSYVYSGSRLDAAEKGKDGIVIVPQGANLSHVVGGSSGAQSGCW